MKYSVIMALDNQDGYAKEGKIPWHFSEDLKRFKKLTMGQVCIMGRNTYEEINNIMGERGAQDVLPGRLSIVLSQTMNNVQNAIVIQNIEQLPIILSNIPQASEVFFIGGKQIFNIGVEIADNIYLTRINQNYSCDSFFKYGDIVTKYTHLTNIKSNNPNLTFLKFSKCW